MTAARCAIHRRRSTVAAVLGSGHLIIGPYVIGQTDGRPGGKARPLHKANYQTPVAVPGGTGHTPTRSWDAALRIRTRPILIPLRGWTLFRRPAAAAAATGRGRPGRRPCVPTRQRPFVVPLIRPEKASGRSRSLCAAPWRRKKRPTAAAYAAAAPTRGRDLHSRAISEPCGRFSNGPLDQLDKDQHTTARQDLSFKPDAQPTGR